jgi:peptidyl-prolyl cis-trans isomerase SurA
MNKISITILSALTAVSMYAQTADPVIMTIGNRSVNKSEFESVFRKNNNKTTVDPKAVRDYADLFALFKMKVFEAESMGLDTAATFKTELAGYRRQLAQPYLTDKNTNENLITEVYDRMKWEIKSSHILIRCSDTEFPKDTLEAWTRATLIRNAITGKIPTAAQIAEYDKLLKNTTMIKSDFAKKDSGLYKSKLNSVKNLSDYYKNAGTDKFEGIAPKTSDDPSVPDNKGDLGYYSALDLVYPYETMMYSMKVGDVSPVTRTKFGYHIIKVYDRRPYPGEITVAHIMVTFPKNASDVDKQNAKTKIDELYKKVKGGEKFEDVARQFSEDKQSSDRGGQLAPFKSRKVPKPFEDAAFALKKDGDISEPIMTQYGWHIIKRLELKGLEPFEKLKPEIKARVARDSRAQMGRVALIARVKKENGFKQNLANRDEIMKVIDTTYLTATWKASRADKLPNKEIITLGKKTYNVKDFAQFLEQQMVYRSPTDLKDLVSQIYEKWVEEVVVAFEDAQLETTRVEFKNLLHEYRDGILLFDLTDQKVWSKAVKDTTGLKDFYNKNKNNYMWEERGDVTTYHCQDAKIAAEVRKMLGKGKSEKEIVETVNKTSQLNVSVDNIMYLKGENKDLNDNWKEGIVAKDVKDEKGNKVSVIKVNKILPRTPKTLNEAKGLVTADFQVNLEKEWIAYLKNKYPIKINEDVLNTIK